MKTKSHTQTIVIATILLTLAAIILLTVFMQNQPRRLYPGEVREYKGENLSSVSDVKENAIRGNQVVNQSSYRLTVDGLVGDPKEYTYDQVLIGFQNYEKVVALHCVEGWSVKILWQGVLVRDLLNQSGVNSNATTVIFHAADGYTTAMPLSYFYENDILMAHKINGLTLPPERGFPFELVAESKFGYKWIKWVTRIELSDDGGYLGYWESRGYSNDAGTP